MRWQSILVYLVESWQRAYDAYGVAFLALLLTCVKVGWGMGQAFGRWTDGGER